MTGNLHLYKNLNYLYKKVNWIRLKDHTDMALDKFTYKLIKNRIPTNFYSQITLPSKQFTRNSNSSKLGNKPKKLNKTKFAQNSLRNRIYRYNNLPEQITNLPNKEDLKKEIKKYYHNNRKIKPNKLKMNVNSKSNSNSNSNLNSNLKPK